MLSIENPVVLSPRVQSFCGRKFYRYGGRRYFQRGVKGGGTETTESLHRAVWKYHNGEIPDGMHVHHKDGNVLNNCIDNLALFSHGEHTRQHWSNHDWAAKQRIRMKAWRSTTQGKEWHSKHIRTVFKSSEPFQITCSHCGRTTMIRDLVKNRPRNFCSVECRLAASYQRKKQRNALVSE